MPRLKTKLRLLSIATSTVTDLSTDVIEMIFGNLPQIDIMRARVCRKKWRQAARNAIAPLAEFKVDTARQYNYNAMEAMVISLSNL